MYNITYRKTQEGHLISSLYLMKDIQGFIYIFPQEFKFEIRGIDDEDVYLVYTETCQDLKECKANARKRLIELGVVFKDRLC